ncbi:hypothetical protein [Staphylococcus caeli]|uniref:Uncharacterized protein n=1 Tax=Staphylococcus caeli TaxID=2201815 RepID=A0A1D4PWV4_9STAP|nr:hypothetical protein [Staphylococcus caeli]SCT27449.1 Uncharacterised protein [Staphylococcus caeli]SCT34511.1 Uncharacterised protein [Staphylococcus caeli]
MNVFIEFLKDLNLPVWIIIGIFTIYYLLKFSFSFFSNFSVFEIIKKHFQKWKKYLIMLVSILILTIAGTAANYLFLDMAVHNQKHLFNYLFFYSFVLLLCLILFAIISSFSAYQLAKISNNLTQKFKYDYKLHKNITIKENSLINKLSIDYNHSVNLNRPKIYIDSKKMEKTNKNAIKKLKKRTYKIMPLTRIYLTIFYSLFFLSILFNTFLICVIINTKFEYLLLTIYALVIIIFIAQCISMFKLIDNMYNYDHLKHYREENDEDDKE